MKNTNNHTVSQPRVMELDFMLKISKASHNHPLGFLIRFLMFTGITVAELLTLSWKNIDLRAKRFYIPELLVGTDNGLVHHPEVHSRYVPLIPQLEQEIIEWEYLQHMSCVPLGFAGDLGHAFATSLDGTLLCSEDVERIFHELLAMCGIGPQPISVLRETYGAYIYETGISAYSFNKIMGDPNAADFYADYNGDFSHRFGNSNAIDRLTSGRW